MSDRHRLLEVTEVHDAGSVRVHLRGEFDLAGAPMVTDRLSGLRARGEPVVLDVDELEFIDMSGLRVVRAAADEAARDGWSFAITPGSPSVRRLIALVGLDGRIPLDGSRR